MIWLDMLITNHAISLPLAQFTLLYALIGTYYSNI